MGDFCSFPVQYKYKDHYKLLINFLSDHFLRSVPEEMKYAKRVFAMDEQELRAVLALVMSGDQSKQYTEAMDKPSMQEALVGW